MASTDREAHSGLLRPAKRLRLYRNREWNSAQQSRLTFHTASDPGQRPTLRGPVGRALRIESSVDRTNRKLGPFRYKPRRSPKRDHCIAWATNLSPLWPRSSERGSELIFLAFVGFCSCVSCEVQLAAGVVQRRWAFGVRRVMSLLTSTSADSATPQKGPGLGRS